LSGPRDSALNWLVVSVILLSMPIRPVVPFPADHPANRAALPQLPSGPQIRAALEWFGSHRAWIDDEQARLTEIPAPTFQEADRASALKVLLSAIGLEVSTDKAGNVIGLQRGATEKEIVVLSAHLDTVFPAGTDVKVHRDS
jgi:tripeptide aminopeptidase